MHFSVLKKKLWIFLKFGYIIEFQPNLTTNNVPYGNGFHEVPVPYVKKIQAGEFFDLSKLLPKNMSTNNQSEDAIILTLENSAIKAKKASNPTARITDIEQWTTAFTVYMSVLTHQYPNRAQELLQYMSLIRHAAATQNLTQIYT